MLLLAYYALDEGRGEAATEPSFKVVRKAGAGTEFCLKKNPTDLKEDQSL